MKQRLHTHTVTVRLTNAQYLKLSDIAAATRKPMADILRLHLAKTPSLKAAPPALPVFDASALKHLSQIGNNVNQIARELHQRVRQGVTPEEFEKLDRALLAVIRGTLKGREAMISSIDIGLSHVLPSPTPTTLENS